MAIEHFIASILTPIILEGKEQKKAKKAMAEQQAKIKAREASMSFNRVRQAGLEALAKKEDKESRLKFAKILGYPAPESNDLDEEIRCIAHDEGWDYYDPVYLYDGHYLGGPLEPILEKHNRNKEWAQKCPHCFSTLTSPKGFNSYEDYNSVVEYEFYKWRQTTLGTMGIKPRDYETLEDFQRACRRAKAHILDYYSDALKALGKDLENENTWGLFFADYINEIEKTFNERPEYIPLEKYFYILYLQKAIFCGRLDAEKYQIIKSLAKKNDVDLEEVLDKAENGTLLLKSEKIYTNNYLGVTIFRPGKYIYTLNKSEYFEAKYAFSLERFLQTCGKNPSWNFTPPVRGIPAE